MIELKLVQQFPQEIIAVDEVGRGPLAGPVVIGAVRVLVQNKAELNSLLKSLKPSGVTDSKKLTSEKRLNILKKLGASLLPYQAKGNLSIKDLQVSYVTWEMDHEVIDKENILVASLRGMKEAALLLSEEKKNGTTVLIDGNKKLHWGNDVSPFNEITIIRGDQLSLLIGLASIVAKEKRDAHMRKMHELYPYYGFDSNFGYPTEAHREAIKQFGPSPFHRKTFSGVKEFVL